MARLAATVFGLSVFRREFAELARDYAEQKFSEGERVQSAPKQSCFRVWGFLAE